MFKKCSWCIVLVLVLASACGGSDTPTGPSFDPPAILGHEVLTGRVTDRSTSAPIAGATVVFSQNHSPSATTDSAGNYSLIGLPAPPSGTAMVWATALSYEDDLRYYRETSQDFRLYPIERIPAGGSALVTVRPDDSLCWNNTHEPGYGSDYVCRIVRIEPTDGVMTVEAFPLDGGPRLPLVVAASAGDRLLVERSGNPVSVQVGGATEIKAFVEIDSDSSTTHSFMLTTSITPR